MAHLALLSLARDHQRAEYLADELSAETAGTEAAVSLFDAMLLAPVYLRVITHSAETAAPDRWPALVAETVTSRAAELLPRRQLSRRRTSMWDSHPQGGLRARVLELRPRREAALVLGENASTQIDRELAGHYRRLHGHVLGTRDFRPLAQAT
ncbi:MAG TPA: hypothetical protein VMB79_15325 [Jatrophihabitans sp.]|nr:hypothetical protein [Jatrophihabitans sp.]